MKEAGKNTSNHGANQIGSSPVSVAPMMDWTDRHCRFFHRKLSPHAILYTEMVTTGALLLGDTQRHLQFDHAEHPVILQLGGSDPAALAESARKAEAYGYDEINLNCGCPSDRVQQGRFGACLMAEPDLVADCIAAMIAAVKIPVTVKCRIGIDNSEDYTFLETFVSRIAARGCATFVIHARKAWLGGLSPKENREIPPLRYDIVARLKQEFPHLKIILNGGLTTLDQCRDAASNFDGIMIGREAYHNPYFLAELDHYFHGTPLPDRKDIALAMIPYIEKMQAEQQVPVHSITRHMLGLFNGLRGAKQWRRNMGDATRSTLAPADLIIDTLRHISPSEQDHLVA